MGLPPNRTPARRVARAALLAGAFLLAGAVVSVVVSVGVSVGVAVGIGLSGTVTWGNGGEAYLPSATCACAGTLQKAVEMAERNVWAGPAPTSACR